MTQAPSTVTGDDRIDLDAIRRGVDAILDEFLRGKMEDASADDMPRQVVQTLRNFFKSGGKRMRPVLCVLGWHAAGGTAPTPPGVLRLAAALEMFHAFALIHDDVMDASATRRGFPTVQCALAEQFTAGRTPEQVKRLGDMVAILVGDLALCWSDELIHTAGLTKEQLSRILPTLDAMRTEVMYGQYLDVTAAVNSNVDSALAIGRYKTSKYTIERPLQLGALVLGEDEEIIRAISSYALPLGDAFQLRDDLLGVFGNPDTTGKSHLDDLRDGKHTALVAMALRDGAPEDVAFLLQRLGRNDLSGEDAARIRDVLTATGARGQVEDLITHHRTSVMQFLDSDTLLDRRAVPHLRKFAYAATRRSA